VGNIDEKGFLAKPQDQSNPSKKLKDGVSGWLHVLHIMKFTIAGYQ
jgi:hypothetical protein